MAIREGVERTLAPFQIFPPLPRSISVSAMLLPCMGNTLNAESSLATEYASPRAMLDMPGVVKRFGAQEVLPSMSLQIPRGETVVAIGPSGSGKTTLPRCVNLLKDYQQGTVTVDGEPVGYTLDRNGRRLRMAEREIATAREKTASSSKASTCFRI